MLQRLRIGGRAVKRPLSPSCEGSRKLPPTLSHSHRAAASPRHCTLAANCPPVSVSMCGLGYQRIGARGRGRVSIRCCGCASGRGWSTSRILRPYDALAPVVTLSLPPTVHHLPHLPPLSLNCHACASLPSSPGPRAPAHCPAFAAPALCDRDVIGHPKHRP